MVFLHTVTSAFFKPTTCSEVGGQVSWSRYCFNLSRSDVSELKADFRVVCTATRNRIRGGFDQCIIIIILSPMLDKLRQSLVLIV